MSAWIEMIEDDNADPVLMDYLKLARTPHGTVDNVMRVHSLRPHTMEGHVVLYRSVLHNANNTLPMWFSEVIASYVSILNKCEYSLANHFKNAAHLMADETKANAVWEALQAHQPELVFSGAELAMLQYAGKLTVAPADMNQDDVISMREAGVSDGDILEVNQVCGYFNYVNRLLNGLGVTTSGDTVGFYKD